MKYPKAFDAFFKRYKPMPYLDNLYDWKLNDTYKSTLLAVWKAGRRYEKERQIKQHLRHIHHACIECRLRGRNERHLAVQKWTLN